MLIPCSKKSFKQGESICLLHEHLSVWAHSYDSSAWLEWKRLAKIKGEKKGTDTILLFHESWWRNQEGTIVKFYQMLVQTNSSYSWVSPSLPKDSLELTNKIILLKYTAIFQHWNSI